MIAIVGGESYFSCNMRAATGTRRTTICPARRDRELDELLAELLERTAGGLNATAIDALVIAWPYQAHLCWSAATQSQLSFIDLLPEDVAFMTEVDVNEKWRIDERTHIAWDYSPQDDRPSSKGFGTGNDLMVDSGCTTRRRRGLRAAASAAAARSPAQNRTAI